jgi:hypothetical protein
MVYVVGLIFCAVYIPVFVGVKLIQRLLAHKFEEWTERQNVHTVKKGSVEAISPVIAIQSPKTVWRARALHLVTPDHDEGVRVLQRGSSHLQ